MQIWIFNFQQVRLRLTGFIKEYRCRGVCFPFETSVLFITSLFSSKMGIIKRNVICLKLVYFWYFASQLKKKKQLKFPPLNQNPRSIFKKFKYVKFWKLIPAHFKMRTFNRYNFVPSFNCPKPLKLLSRKIFNYIVSQMNLAHFVPKCVYLVF